MILSYKDHVEALQQELLKKPQSVWIGTFGLNVGVSEYGKIWTPSSSYRLFSNLPASSRIMVGLAVKPYPGFKKRLVNSAEYFRKLEFRTRIDMHLKCWIFIYQSRVRALVGGRNVGDSEWADASVWLGDTSAWELRRFYEKLWQEAKPVKLTKGLVKR